MGNLPHSSIMGNLPHSSIVGNLPHSSIMGNLPYRPTENAEHETMDVKYARVPRHRRDFSGVKREEPMLRARTWVPIIYLLLTGCVSISILFVAKVRGSMQQLAFNHHQLVTT